MARWDMTRSMPSQAGRVAVVTGANSGLGFEIARALARKGADVILACRDQDKAAEAVLRISKEAPQAGVWRAELDLADLDSVARFSAWYRARHTTLDLLINNAGVMVPPFSHTKQNVELQFGTNHLGHFALTAQLLPMLLRTTGSRIAVQSSAGANFGSIDFNDLQFERRSYRKWPAYMQSKLAELLFGLELARRLKAADAETIATLAHPGGAATDLQRSSWWLRTFVNPLVMSTERAAQPLLRAATDPSAENGSYWAPGGLGEMRGNPEKAYVPKRAQNLSVARRLWQVSESMTGVPFPVGRLVGEAQR